MTAYDDLQAAAAVAPDAPSSVYQILQDAAQQPDGALPAHPTAGPSGNMWTDLERRAATAGTDALAGFLSLPRLATGAVDWLGRKAGIDVGADPALASVADPSNPAAPLFPDPAQAKAMAFQTTGATEYVPQTTLGRLAQAGLTGVASGGPFSLLGSGARTLAGAGPDILQAVKQIPAQFGGAAASEGAGEAAQKAGLPPAAQTAARMVGFVPGAAAANVIASGATRLGGAAIGAGGAGGLADAYSRLGIDPALIANVQGSPTLRAFQGFAARMPGSSDAVGLASAKAVGQWQDALDRTSASMGTAQTPTELGDALQTGANNWLDTFKQNNDTNWNAFRKLVPSNTPISVANFDNELSGILGDYQGANNLRNIFQDNLAGRSFDALQQDASSGALPWGTVQTIRSAIGDKLSSPQIISDTSQVTLKRLYGSLSEDMRTGAQMQGGSAATLFDLANAYTAGGHGLIEGALSGLLKPDISPEQAAQFAMGQARLGATRVSNIAGAIPGASGEMGSYALQNAATNIDSPTSLATNLAGRRPMYSPDVQSVLFSDPATAQAVKDLTDVGMSLKDAQNYVNQTMSGVTANIGAGRLLTMIEMAKMGRDLGGSPGAVAGGLLGFSSPELLAKTAGKIAMPGPVTRRLMNAPGFTPPDVGMLPLWAQRAAVASQPQPAPSLLNQ